jgi:hypothetical protein
MCPSAPCPHGPCAALLSSAHGTSARAPPARAPHPLALALLGSTDSAAGARYRAAASAAHARYVDALRREAALERRRDAAELLKMERGPAAARSGGDQQLAQREGGRGGAEAEGVRAKVFATADEQRAEAAAAAVAAAKEASWQRTVDRCSDAGAPIPNRGAPRRSCSQLY